MGLSVTLTRLPLGLSPAANLLLVTNTHTHHHHRTPLFPPQTVFIKQAALVVVLAQVR